tara:strand:+ start:54791 stop:55111 length:321 start_codon:yes stop_codon:yes gene_type:complete
MTGPLDESRPDLARALQDSWTEYTSESIRRDRCADLVSRLRDLDGSGSWLHEPRRPAPVRRWPAYLAIMVAALIIALIVGTWATAGISSAAQFQITPNTAHLCGAC